MERKPAYRGWPVIPLALPGLRQPSQSYLALLSKVVPSRVAPNSDMWLTMQILSRSYAHTFKILLCYQSQVHRMLRSIEKKNSNEVYNCLFASDSMLGVLYGLPLVHKIGCPISVSFQHCIQLTRAGRHSFGGIASASIRHCGGCCVGVKPSFSFSKKMLRYFCAIAPLRRWRIR